MLFRSPNGVFAADVGVQCQELNSMDGDGQEMDEAGDRTRRNSLLFLFAFGTWTVTVLEHAVQQNQILLPYQKIYAI